MVNIKAIGIHNIKSLTKNFRLPDWRKEQKGQKIMYGIYKAATDGTLKPIDKAIIMFLFTLCGTKGYCWPSYETIAKNTGVSRRYVIQRMKFLEFKGYVLRSKGTRKTSNAQSSNKYFINNNPE